MRLYQAGQPYNRQVLSANQMVAWWKFEETKGEAVIDSSGKGLDGKLVGDAHIISDPVRGNVLSLDGDGDYVEIEEFDLNTNSATFIAWINGWKMNNCAGIVLHRSLHYQGELACGMGIVNKDTLNYIWNNNDQTT